MKRMRCSSSKIYLVLILILNMQLLSANSVEINFKSVEPGTLLTQENGKDIIDYLNENFNYYATKTTATSTDQAGNEYHYMIKDGYLFFNIKLNPEITEETSHLMNPQRMAIMSDDDYAKYDEGDNKKIIGYGDEVGKAPVWRYFGTKSKNFTNKNKPIDFIKDLELRWHGQESHIGKIEMVAADRERIFIRTEDGKYYFAVPRCKTDWENNHIESYVRSDPHANDWSEKLRNDYETESIDRNSLFGLSSLFDKALQVPVNESFVWYQLEDPKLEYSKKYLDDGNSRYVRDTVIDIAVNHVYQYEKYNDIYYADYYGEHPLLRDTGKFEGNDDKPAKYGNFVDGITTFYLLVRRDEINSDGTIKQGGRRSYHVRWVDEQSYFSTNDYDGSGSWRDIELSEELTQSGYATLNDISIAPEVDFINTMASYIVEYYLEEIIEASQDVNPVIQGGILAAAYLFPEMFTITKYIIWNTLELCEAGIPIVYALAESLPVPIGILASLIPIDVFLFPLSTPALIVHTVFLGGFIVGYDLCYDDIIGMCAPENSDENLTTFLSLSDYKEIEPFRPFVNNYWWDPSNSDYLSDESRIDATHSHILLSGAKEVNGVKKGKLFSIGFNYGVADVTWRTRNLPDNWDKNLDHFDINEEMCITIGADNDRDGIRDGSLKQNYYDIDMNDNGFDHKSHVPVPSGKEAHFPHEAEWEYSSDENMKAGLTYGLFVTEDFIAETEAATKELFDEQPLGQQFTRYVTSQYDKYNRPTEAINYIQFTEAAKVLPLDFMRYYPDIAAEFSINGGSFKKVTRLENFDGFASIEECLNYFENIEYEEPVFVHNTSGNGVLISPQFKEGYNAVTVRFKNFNGDYIYKELLVMQLTVPPFITPIYPMMNQYIGENSFEAKVICEHITGDFTMPEGWFSAANLSVLADGNEISNFKLSESPNTITFDLNDLEDGSHFIEIKFNIGELEASNHWRFWVDTTPPEITFPDKIVFANKNKDNVRVLSWAVNDTIPFRNGDDSYETDTVFLTNMKMDIENSGVPLKEFINENSGRMGVFTSQWNGWNDDVPFEHGIYTMNVSATDRVGNMAGETKDVVIDNRAPIFNIIDINNYLITTKTGGLDIYCNMDLDDWEETARLEIVIENLLDNQKMRLFAYAKDNLDMTFPFFNGGDISLLKDGLYNFALNTLDDLENKGDTVLFENIVVDLTHPHIYDVYVNPFVIKDGDKKIQMKFSVDEDQDVDFNKSDFLDIVVRLSDFNGNGVTGFTEYSSSIEPGKTFNEFIGIPDALPDGKYIFQIELTDKNGNESVETAVFIKDGLSPEITFPEENEIITGSIGIYGNIYDPVWDNNFALNHYEFYYRSGFYNVPEDLTNLSGWQNEFITVPQYQRNPLWPDSFGSFIVENEGLIGSIDTLALNNEEITVLVIAEEEQGYRIGAVKHYCIENDLQSNEIEVEINPAFKSNTELFDFNFISKGVIDYEISNSISNPVDVYSFVKSEDGRVMQKSIYYNLNSENIKGKPGILNSDHGIYLYQDEDSRIHLSLKNSADYSEEKSFSITLISDEELTSFNNEENVFKSQAEDHWNYSIYKKVAPEENYEISFSLPEYSQLFIATLIDNNIGELYIGKDKKQMPTGSSTLYPGSDYPPIKWNGKDTLGRYVANGTYTVGVEAYGRRGGKGEDTCQIEVITPYIADRVEVQNPEIQPGVETLNYCRVKVYMNKPGYLEARVFNANDNTVKNIVTDSITRPGYITLDWYADDENAVTVKEGAYHMRIITHPAESETGLTLDKTTHEQLGALKVLAAKSLNTGINASLLSFDNAKEHDGKEVVTGDSTFQVEVKPEGQYLPDREVQLDVDGVGTQVVEAYPDLNYMAAFRTIYTELWAAININQLTFTAKYQRNAPDKKIITTKTIYDSAPVVTYNSLGFINKPGLNYDIQTTLEFEVDERSYDQVIFVDSDFEKISAVEIDDNDIKIFTFSDQKYIGESTNIKSEIISWEYVDKLVDNLNIFSNSYRIRCTILVTGHYSVSEDFEIGNYLAICDGIAVMGPDIITETDYSHKTGYVSKNKPLLNYVLIKHDPITETGMELNNFKYLYRRNPQYYFYYIGEDYVNYSGDSGKESTKKLISFKKFDVKNKGGGENHKNPIAMPDGVQKIKILTGDYRIDQHHIEQEYDYEYTHTVQSGKIKFTFTRKIDWEEAVYYHPAYEYINSDTFSVTVSTDAEDRICYPFPANVTKQEFNKPHSIGNSELGIPTTTINDKRKPESNIPNFHVPKENIYFVDKTAVEIITTGTQVVKTYPDLNYMAALRVNYQELWVQLMIEKVNFRILNYYNRSYKPSYKQVAVAFNHITDHKMISYHIDKNTITKTPVSNFITECEALVEIPDISLEYIKQDLGAMYRNKSELLYLDIDVKDWITHKVISGTNYASDINIKDVKIINKNFVYIDKDENIVKLNKEKIMGYELFDDRIRVEYFNDDGDVEFLDIINQKIKVKIRVTMDCPIDPQFSTIDYLRLCDGVAVMGPDIPFESHKSAHYTDYVYSGKEFTPINLINLYDLETAGMNHDDQTCEGWRKNPKYYFYYIGEDYATVKNNDTPTTNFNSLTNNTDYNPNNQITTDKISTSDLPSKIEPFHIPSDFSEKTFTNGAVNFHLKKDGPQYSVSVSTDAEDRINYPFPAPENITKQSFNQPHTIGSSELGIPTTTINGTRNPQSSIPNFHVPKDSVYFIDNSFTMNSLLTFDHEKGYRSTFDMSAANANTPSLVSIKKWTNPRITSPGITFTDLPTEYENDEELKIPLSGNHIATIDDAHWNLSQDTLSGGNTLLAPPEDLEDYYDRLLKYGKIKEVRVSDLYPFSAKANLNVKNIFHTDNDLKKQDNPAVIIQPDGIKDYSGTNAKYGYDIKLTGIDNDPFKGLQLSPPAYFGKGAKHNDGFYIERSGDKPRKLAAVYGSAQGDFNLSYSHDSLNWHDIPIYNSDPAKNILSYWDVTGLSGSYTLRLFSNINDEYNIALKELYIGHVVNTADAEEDRIINSASGEAQIIFPKNAVTEDVIMNIDTLEMSDIEDIAILPDIAPVGKVVNLTPDGYVFENAYPQIHFLYTREDIAKLEIDPRELVIYHLKLNGELEPLNTIKHLMKVVYNDDGSYKDEYSVWDSQNNKSGDPVPEDYTYLKVWTVTTHFSYYLVLEGLIKEKPSIEQTDFLTGETQVNLSGHGMAGEEIGLFVGGSIYYMKENSPSPIAFTTVNNFGVYGFNDVSLPREGKNYLFTQYTTNNGDQYAKVVVTRDTTPPEADINNFYKYLSPNDDGAFDTVPIELTPAKENVTVRADVIEKLSRQTAFTTTFTTPAGKKHIWRFNGKDHENGLLFDGLYTIRFNVTDPGGNTSVYEKDLVIDTQEPYMNLLDMTEIISPANSDSKYDTAQINLRISEPVDINFQIINKDQIKVRELMTKMSLNTGKRQLIWDGKDNYGNYLADGEYWVLQNAVDLAGNKLETAYSNSIIVDNTPAEIIPGFYGNQYFNLDEPFSLEVEVSEESVITLSAIDETGMTVYQPVYECAKGPNSLFKDVPASIKPGAYSISLKANDRAGNLTEQITIPVNLVNDSTPPEITLTGITENAKYGIEGVTPVIEIFDEYLDTVSMTLTKDADAPADFTSGIHLSEQGDYTIYVKAADKLKRLSENTIHFKIDLTPPQNTTRILYRTDNQDNLLNWKSVITDDFAYYNIYRDHVLIAENITDITYRDLNTGPGTFGYIITSIDDVKNESHGTEIYMINSNYPTPEPEPRFMFISPQHIKIRQDLRENETDIRKDSKGLLAEPQTNSLEETAPQKKGKALRLLKKIIAMGFGQRELSNNTKPGDNSLLFSSLPPVYNFPFDSPEAVKDLKEPQKQSGEISLSVTPPVEKARLISLIEHPEAPKKKKTHRNFKKLTWSDYQNCIQSTMVQQLAVLFLIKPF